MSMVAAVKGYKMLVLMPDGMSPERTAISEAFGAEVKKMGDFHVNAALAEAKRLGDLPGYFSPQQFDNEQNVDENREWLGQEILKQLPGKPDLVVSGVGTGGTVIGVGQAFKAVNPDCKVIALEPSESCTILCGEIDKHLIEGIADGFIPGIIENHRDELDGVIDVHSDEAIEEMRRIARVHGIFVGPSSGAHLIAAKRLKEKYNVENVVTFFCDEGEKYINDYWIKK
jgi:cysteine synthase A